MFPEELRRSETLTLKALRIFDRCEHHVCRQLQFNDFWKMFGEGKHMGIDKLYEAKLAPFLTQTSLRFWTSRLWYFKQGLYYQGGMVSPSPPCAMLPTL